MKFFAHIEYAHKTEVKELMGLDWGVCYKVLVSRSIFAGDAGQTNIWHLLEGSRVPLSAV